MTARHRLMMCALCRYRHNQHYPDIVVMPIFRRLPLAAGVAGLAVSA
jgi:hypothetical protein